MAHPKFSLAEDKHAPLKILFLTLYDESGASSQVRVYQFLPYFRKVGLLCKVEPFLTGNLREQTYVLKRGGFFKQKITLFFQVMLHFFSRFLVVLKSSSYDIVFVQKDVLPFGMQYLLFKLNKNVIYDFDDTLWELDVQQKKSPRLSQIFYRYRIKLFQKMLGRAKMVVTSNTYLADYAKKFNSNVINVCAPVDTNLYKPFPKKNKDKVVLGWIGSSSTTYLFKNMEYIFTELEKKHKNLELFNIGGDIVNLKNVSIKNIPWSQESIMNDFSKIDIGLMPLDASEANKGRLGYKMILYASLGIPTVAENIGLNSEVIFPGQNGFLVQGEKEWIDVLSRLIEDENLRRVLGKNARDLALTTYDKRKYEEQYVAIFNSFLKSSMLK